MGDTAVTKRASWNIQFVITIMVDLLSGKHEYVYPGFFLNTDITTDESSSDLYITQLSLSELSSNQYSSDQRC